MPVVEPMPPFKTIEEERADLMYKLSRAARMSNIPVKQFVYNTDIREIRTEVARVKAEQDVTASIAFQRQLLMTICSGLEFANRKFSVMDLNLDGWSESVLEDIGKYDRIFEKLHGKHAGKMNIPPEVELILMIGGSAVTWHLTHTLMGRMGGSRDPPRDEHRRSKKHKKHKKSKKRRRYDSDSEDDLERSPRDRFMREQHRRGPPSPQRSGGRPQRREMRGPGFDVGALMGAAGPGGMAPMMFPGMNLPPMSAMPVEAFGPPQPTRGPDTMPSVAIREVEESPEAELDPPPAAGPSTQGDSLSERLSDIASEDLPVLPDTFDEDLPAGDDDENRVIDVPIAPPSKKARGSRKKADATKKVVVI